MNSMNSHRKLLQYNKVNILTLNDTNIETTLRNLTTRKNKPLGDNYIIALLSTIKKFNKDVTLKPSKLNLNTVRKNKTPANENRRGILNVIKYTYSLNMETLQLISTTSNYDIYIAILMLTATNINISDLFDLNLIQFKQLIDTDILILSKKIIKMQHLFALALPIIKNLVILRTEKFKNHPTFQMKPKFTTHIITCTPDVLNKKLKELYTMINFTEDSSELSLGLNYFSFKHPNLILAYFYGESASSTLPVPGSSFTLNNTSEA